MTKGYALLTTRSRSDGEDPTNLNVILRLNPERMMADQRSREAQSNWYLSSNPELLSRDRRPRAFLLHDRQRGRDLPTAVATSPTPDPMPQCTVHDTMSCYTKRKIWQTQRKWNYRGSGARASCPRWGSTRGKGRTLMRNSRGPAGRLHGGTPRIPLRGYGRACTSRATWAPPGTGRPCVTSLQAPNADVAGAGLSGLLSSSAL
jgi:hypothetical protein